VKNRVLATVAVVAAGALAAGCGGSDTTSNSSSTPSDSKLLVLGQTSSPAPKGEPVSGGSLIMDRNVEPQSFDPIGTSDTGSINAQMQVYDQLIELLPGSLDPQPGLASSWKTSSDGLTYSFQLRDAKFSDGTPVTADDVVFSIRRFMGPDDPYAFMVTSVKSVEATGRNEVVMKLKEPNAALLYALSLAASSIVSEDAYKQLGPKKFAVAPVGSGAFSVASFKQGDKVVLKRNPHYWRDQQPYLDEVVMRYVPDDNARILDITSGQADVAEAISYSQVQELDGKPGMHVEIAPITGIEHIYLNNSDERLSDRRVRQALGLATPVKQLLKALYFGHAGPANDVIAPGKYTDPDVAPLAYNVEQAKQLLDDAGYADGFELTLTIPGGDSTAKQLAAILQNSWEQIGVTLKITQVADGGAVYADISKGSYQAAYFGVDTADVPVQDELYPFLYAKGGNGNNTLFKTTAKLDSDVKEAITSLDEDRRQELFGQVQRAGMRELMFLPLAFASARTAVRDEVQNFQTIPSNWWRLEQVWKSEG